jgi:uncharacterized protein with GYD domain
MPRLVTRGRFTHDYLKGLMDAPEDREVPVRKVVEAAGGKVISFYVTTANPTSCSFRKLTRVRPLSPR